MSNAQVRLTLKEREKERKGGEKREEERKGGEKREEREERDEEANPLKIPINLTLLEIGLFRRLHIALFARVL